MKKSTKVKAGLACGVAAAAAATAYAQKKASKRFVTTDGQQINSSESLTQKLEQEKGHEMKRINSMGGTFGTFSRRDKSWKNAGDFFNQMVHGRSK